MGSNSLTPRAFDIRQAARAREEEARRREQVTSARNTERTTVSGGGRLDIDGGDLTVKNGGNAVVKDGGRFLVQGGGSMDITDNGEVSVTGQGIDGFTNAPIVSRLKFGNREAVHSWTGLSFMQPGVYLEGEAPGDILDTPRLTGVINRDGLITRSGRRQAEGRPPNIMEQSSSLCTPWTATIGTIRYDSLINWDGEDGLAGREFSSSFSTSPSVASGMVEDVLNKRSYFLNLSADPLMATSGKTGAVLAIKSWHMSPSTGWIRVDDGGLIDIQATVGAKRVGVTSEVAGKLQLLATDGVDVQGPFTVDGLPVGGAPEWTDVKNKPTTFPPSTHTHTKSQITDFPTTMPPSAHTHTIAQVTGLQAALDAKAAPLAYRRVAGTSLPPTLTTAYVSFASAVTVPANYFGVGVPYLIEVFAQLQANPTAGNLVSIQILINGAVPPGGQVNGVTGPNFANVTASAAVEVTTSAATAINPQAVAPFGATTIGTTGAAAPFFTIKISPYTAF